MDWEYKLFSNQEYFYLSLWLDKNVNALNKVTK